jgi:membrane protein DedA with SNARE-associated domain
VDAAIPAEPPVVEASPRAKQLILVAAGILYATGTFGSNVGPAWVDDRPELLLAFSSRNRNLFASVPFIDPIAYSLIGFSRLFVTGMALYFLGRWWGHRFLTWTERQLGTLPTVYRWFRTAIDRAGWLLVLLMPGSNLVCMMAGYRRMRVGLFSGLLAVGIVGKLIVLWAGGRIFEDEIRSFLDAISKYQWWIVIGLFGISFMQSGMQARKSMARLDAESVDATNGAIDVTERVPGDDDRH